MTPEQIREARALCEAATAGPWRIPEKPAALRAFFGEANTVCPSDPFRSAVALVYGDPDRAFIAAARTLLPLALDAIEERDAEIARLRRELDAAVVAHKGNEDRLLPALLENARLRDALHVAIHRPMGVVPDEAAEFYNPAWPDPGEQAVS